MMMQSQAGEMLGAGDRVGAGWGGWGRTKEEGGYGLRRVRAGEEGGGAGLGWGKGRGMQWAICPVGTD